MLGEMRGRIVKGHGIAVIFASDSNIQRRVRWKRRGMLFEALDQINVLPSSLYAMDFTKLEKLITLKRM